MRAWWTAYTLNFNFVARTSRETLRQKPTYFIHIADAQGHEAMGEAALFRGLSADDRDGYEEMLSEVCRALTAGADLPDLTEWSSIRMSVETAVADFKSGCRGEPFYSGRIDIPINGLIWIADFDTTIHEIERKAHDFEVIKIKVGQLQADEEAEILRYLRKIRPDVTIRLDANGAFRDLDHAMTRIEAYARHGIHSIEQPVAARQPELMAEVVKRSPVAVALDEELIGITSADEMDGLMEQIRPAYVILKPTLCGGFAGSDAWIATAGRFGAGWWLTSALESNVGLNAIARYAMTRPTAGLCQGLGTGQIYSNNIPSRLRLTKGRLYSTFAED